MNENKTFLMCIVCFLLISHSDGSVFSRIACGAVAAFLLIDIIRTIKEKTGVKDF